MKKKVTVSRIDGIVYTKEVETQELSSTINMRYNSSKLARLKEIAEKKGIGYQTMIRQKLDELLEEN